MIHETPLLDIRIGTLVPGVRAPEYIPQILPYGFESFSLTFGPADSGVDFAKLSDAVKRALGDSGAVISSLGVFGNPLGTTEEDARLRELFERAIDSVHLFGADIVAGFAGRVRGASIPDSIPRFKEVFGPLAKRAADQGVRIAFENCAMGGNWQTGDWNIAHNPDAWELMFDALPDDNLGLEWEPCHQLVQLIEPVAQLRKWVRKVFHLHGKDATIRWDVVRTHGIQGAVPWCFHRTPGFGDTNWSDIISELRMGGFRGSIDIEGWHDPVYRDDLEMTGQVRALRYLKECRGGEFVPNPK
ncbi:MAG: sugar phosphate isomerase/epimerase [Candidatus Hydrogenedentota bacterium]|nr:MAG: sugar phosphate isomerase/epimerase [Candidatus Hydrogenedentota bacterium]GIX45729.1 MAG: sugar phosphate isomerase [Candidatus Sumerlaea sp.]